MSFDYDKSKHAHSSDSFWTSYSDLFLGLSTIFLLLYVVASLRTGTDALRSQIDSQKLTMENEELRNQLRMYESVKSNYMEKSASKNEVAEYQELMDKLSLLREEATNDKERLARESLENDRKAEALNKYQQMIRNVINANKMAKTKILARNDLISEQDTTIDQQKSNIGHLEKDVAEKKNLIERGERRIAATNAALVKNQQKLEQSYKDNQISKQAFEDRARRLNEEASQKVQALKAANEAHVRDLQNTFAAEKQADRAAFDAELAKSNLNANEKAKRLAEFRAAAAVKEREMQNQLAGIQGQLGDTSRKLASAQGELGNARSELASTRGALARAKEEMDARREVAREIKKGFAGAGIKADVDMQTGEVVLDFGNHYFESDSAKLKSEMKQIIEKAMPVYSRSLFGNRKIATKISSVEIIGFASPTYKGRYVDPTSESASDRAALKYNMDLSYRRANSIFNYLVEENGPEFEHKRGLMALMKVSGRSFLDVMKVQGNGGGPMKASEFCKLNDCKRAQRVIVRFSMDGKK